MMADLAQVLKAVEAYVNEDALTAHQAVSPSHTTNGSVKVATVAERITGFARYTTTDTGKTVEIITEGVVEVIASAAIAVLTSDEPTYVEAAATGRVKALGTGTGNHEVIGRIHPRSPAAVSAGDHIWIIIEPRSVYVA